MRNKEISARAVTREVRGHLRYIEAAAAKLAAWAERQTHIPQEFEWLLDNRYLAHREGGDAARVMKRAGRVPAQEGMPVVYRMACDLAQDDKDVLDAARIAAFLDEAQKERPLTERELWLFVPMLRAALVAHIRDACREMLIELEGYESKSPRDPFAAELLVRQARREGSPPPAGAEELSRGASGTHERLSKLMSSAITSLRQLSSLDLTDVLRDASCVEQILQRDPAGVYPQMSEASQAWYRQQVTRLAKRRGVSENEIAEQAVEQAEISDTRRHVGAYLLDEQRKSGWYFSLMAALTAVLAVLTGWLSDSFAIAMLLLLPAWDIAKNVTDFIAVRVTRPRHIPRLELQDGIPDNAKTLVVISALLTDSQKGPAFAEKLREYEACNRDAGENLMFGLLCDLPDSRHKNRAGDKRILEEAQKAMFALSRELGGRCYLFFRERRLHVRDGLFMGWERKRGALLELTRLILGKPGGMTAVIGDPSQLRQVQYIITLDADTRLTAGSAREMAGAMLHPLCRPVVDSERRVVTQGYGLLQPRAAIDLESAGKSFFSRVYAGQGGLDPYGGGSSDVYQDLFDSGSFVGKGIFHVPTFHACLDDRLPENRILSHDLLEGEYLHSGLIGDVELTDGYPYKTGAWFDRLHRWTRGDWQIATWLFPYVKTASGRERNPLPAFSRYKIFDNLRRSVTPVFLFAAISSGLMIRGAAGWTALLFSIVCASCTLLLSAGELAARRGAGGGVRVHSTIIPGLRGAFWQTALQLLFLPNHAFVCAHAVITSCYRIAFSHKKLLQWVTAAESERYAYGVVASARKMFPAVAAGVLTACLTMSVTGWAVGLLWMLSPVIAARISKPRAKQRELPDADRAFLTRQAALIWQYFEDFLTPEDNYLPPDNWQEQPAAGLAHRTSPTNIGLALLCALAAIDLQLASPDRALRLIEHMLSVVEDLPKWNGHIYNWYDTQSLQPLRPRMVSTVDSGNLAGCLIALREGLRELEHPAAAELSERAGRLADGMRFAPLFDSKRRLFAIGYDIEADKLTEGLYDLLASEARQTSYIAVARGEISRKHWRRLGRTLSACDGYRGMASWTGTMFEYLMPHLLMPFYENSLLYESSRFALHCQMKRGFAHHAPWGISESCFYAFDPALSYQYKAHGVPKLAFKRGLGRELVISPYSTFLALPLLPAAAMKNLRRLRGMGLEGRYGLLEAADFSPARLTGQNKFETVRCFMSHHLGMSLLAIDNTLADCVMQKRFMRDTQMRAYAELLQEKVPLGVGTLRQTEREVPDKPVRAPSEGLVRSFSSVNPAAPRCHLLGNASYTLLCTDTGLSASYLSELALTRFSGHPTEGAGGIRFFVRYENELYSLTSAPDFADSPQYAARFDSSTARWSMEAEHLRVEMTAFVPENENAELREVKLTNTQKRIRSAELFVYFEPVLMPQRDFDAHPAYAKLFLESSLQDGALVLHRRSRVGKTGAYMAFVCDQEEVKFETSRERAWGRGGCLFPAAPPENGIGTVLDPCVLARVPLRLEPGQAVSVRFALSVAADGFDAQAAAVRTLKSAPGAGQGRMDGAIRLLGLSAQEALQALDLLRELVFPPSARKKDELARGQRDLWPFGISGDLPMLTVLSASPDHAERLSRVIRQHRFLGLCGAGFDLVVLTRDGGDYRRPVRAAVMDALKAIGCENLLGAKGGVHVADLTALPPEDETLLLCEARAVWDLSDAAEKPKLTISDAVGRWERPAWRKTRVDGVPVKTGYTTDNAFTFDIQGTLPELAWSHTLANRAFGAIMRETGPVTLWRANARENKLTPWDNDPLAVDSAETLTLTARGQSVSLFAAPDGHFCAVTYGFGFARWEKQAGDMKVVTTAFVPVRRNARIILVEVTGAHRAEIHWRMRPQMGVGASEQRFVSLTRDPDGLIRAQNRHNTAFHPQTLTLDTSGPADSEPELTGGVISLSVQMTPSHQTLRAVLVAGCAQNEPGIRLLRELTDFDGASELLRETSLWWREQVCPVNIQSPDTELNHYMGGWALYQALCVRQFARASLYQCGGAYGFRDQLQDSCALLYTDPRYTRNQILRACAHQFEEGDVQHWWHPGLREPGCGERGVRTRCSDDLLWLPYTVCEYLDKTGDESILSQKAPYLSSEPLGPDADDRFESPRIAGTRDSVYGHCMRAIDCALHRGVGVHGLPLIGAGDWNDGFNEVGAEGKGESVWLAWFLAEVLRRVTPVCERQNDRGRADYFRAWAEKLLAAAQASWDGAWYRRGYYDDGSTLGSAGDEECQIDALPQAFAALFSEVPQERRQTALQSALQRLEDKENKLIRLFDPSFAHSRKNPGYIKGYVAGVRENGGQYTHAAVWLARGCFRAGLREDGKRLMLSLLPETHDPAIYKAEPHVLAADVYHNPQHTGRGGWTHYTGAAAWYYRVAMEDLLEMKTERFNKSITKDASHERGNGVY